MTGVRLGWTLPWKIAGLVYFRIGIECDAPRHIMLESARAREVWRPKVLRHAVPHVHRVSSYGWMHARDLEKRKLREAVESTVGRTGTKP